MIKIRKRSQPVKKSKKIKHTIHRNKNIIIGILIIFLLIIIGFYVFVILNEPNESNGDDFTFTSVDGDELRLSNYRGKIIILDMWATWCRPCRSQMIELKKIYDIYPNKDLEIISIDVDTSETINQIRDFINSFKVQEGIELNWIFGKDDGNIWEKYKMANEGIPTLCIFDQDGNLYYQDEGAKDSGLLSQKIEDLL